MQQSDFYKFSELFKNSLVYRKKDEYGNTFVWSVIQWLRYINKFGEILYKKSLSEEEPFNKITFLRKINSKKNLNVTHQLQQSYNAPLSITKEKKGICCTQLVLLHLLASEHRSFYEKLPADETLRNTDPD